MYKEKFIVLGSNSFSGSSFVSFVLQDNPEAEVIGISRSPEYDDFLLAYKNIEYGRFRFYQLDLNSQLDKIVEIVHTYRPDYIVNFAAQGMVAQSWSDPAQWFKTNCLAINNLANHLKEANYLKRYVQISSPEVYGSCSGIVKENTLLNPSTPYAASKASGDLSLIPYFKNYNFPLVYTRATNVYGAFQQLYRIIPRSILYIKMGKKISLHGGGKAIKSYIHIKDACDATLKIARHGKNGEIYHISPDGNGISIINIIEIICKKLGKKIDDCVGNTEERFGQDAAYIIDSSKARKELGWKPKIYLDQGIDEVIAWVENNFEKMIKTSMDYIHKP